MIGGYLLSSGVLFGIAEKAYQRLKDVPSDTLPDQRDALVSILFSAATLEAYINELTLHVNHAPSISGPFQPLAAALNNVEEGNGSVRLKFMLTKIILSGEPYDKGAPPYQDFDLLFVIRNAIVHLKPEHVTGDEHKILKRLRAKKLCASTPASTGGGWIHQIATRAVSKWSCLVVGEMIQSVQSCLPEGKEFEAFVRILKMNDYSLTEA